MAFSEGLVGAVRQLVDTAQTKLRFGNQNDAIVSQLHARYYEQVLRGNVWVDGMTLTSIANAIWSFASTTDATIKGIVGLYNPSNSGVNCVLLQAFVGVTITAATNTGGGPYVWVKSTGEGTGISTGTAPTNALTLTTAGPRGGSAVKGMCGIAPTGKANAVTILGASSLCGGSSANFSFVGTAAGQATAQVTSVELIDGMIVVAPGTYVGLMATATPAAHSAAGRLVWEEVPIL